MLFFYVNNSDRTDDVMGNRLRIDNQIQQRADSCNFVVFNGSKPTENQEIKIFDGALVSTHVTTTIVLQESYEVNIQAFRPGQKLILQVGSAEEEATVLTYTESTRTIVLTAAPTVSLSSGDKIGEIIFGGNVGRVQDENLHSLANIEYVVTGIDYTKIFDKKIISDTWTNVDSRYIINDFVNTTVNYNSTLDNLDYADNTAIQAEWLESGDGNNPTIDSSDFMEGDACGVFSWTFSGGTAIWTGSPTAKDLSDLVGASSGTPTKGFMMGWFKTADFADITSVKIRLGSDSSNYAEFTMALVDSTDWQYSRAKFTLASVTGTPVWSSTDYAQLRIAETASGSIRWNGLRVNAQGSFTLFNVQSTPSFDDFRSPQIKPTALINQLAKQWEYVWYIDYYRDIHFVEHENDAAPFELNDTSNNFLDLSVEVDASNVGNRIIIRGGEKTSTSIYAQVFEGDEAVREWVLKSKFNNLTVSVDKNTSTDLAEAGTSTTTINATAHGLAVGDHIVNRTRSNAVRQVLTVPGANSFTVEAVTSQTNGDTFSKFATSKTVGIEGITDETTVEYVQNSNEKSVRATALEVTLNPGEFIRFAYNERIPIQIQYTDSASANSLKALGLGDGVFDLDPVTDRNIQDLDTAISIAEAKVREFSNPIINATFKTDQKGLAAGQILHIQQTTNRSLDDNFVIQKVTKKQSQGRFKDYFEYSITAGTTLFGWIEFVQKLLRAKDSIELNVDDIVETFATADETVESSDSNAVQLSGFETATGPEIATSDDANTITETTVPWQWETSTGQGLQTRWQLFEWG